MLLLIEFIIFFYMGMKFRIILKVLGVVSRYDYKSYGLDGIVGFFFGKGYLMSFY